MALFPYSKKTLVGVVYRLAGVAAKFVLVLYISKVLSLEELGIYNIFTTTVAWSVFLLGFEFHWFSTREIVGEQKAKIGNHIYNQFIFHLCGMISIPIIVAITFYAGFIPGSLIVFFILITLFDQFSQEGSRILIALNKSQISNLIFLVKHGLWIYVLFGFLLTKVVEINLIGILAFWFLAMVSSVIIVLYNFNKLGLLKKEYMQIDFEWIKRGVVTSWPFLIGTISALVLDYSSRYFIDYFMGKQSVGIYSFYYGIASIPITLITSVIVAQQSPALVEIYKYDIENRPKKIIVVRQFIFQNLIVTVLFALVAMLLIGKLISFVDKPELTESLPIFYYMLAYVFIYSLDTVAHSVMYSKHLDKLILATSVVGGVCNLILNYILISRFGLQGAVLSMVASAILMLMFRLFLLFKTSKKNKK